MNTIQGSFSLIKIHIMLDGYHTKNFLDRTIWWDMYAVSMGGGWGGGVEPALHAVSCSGYKCNPNSVIWALYTD